MKTEDLIREYMRTHKNVKEEPIRANLQKTPKPVRAVNMKS